jgi:hypothetical protein
MCTIIVAEDDSKNASGLEMPSWRNFQAYSVWPPYQVIRDCNLLVSELRLQILYERCGNIQLMVQCVYHLNCGSVFVWFDSEK